MKNIQRERFRILREKRRIEEKLKEAQINVEKLEQEKNNLEKDNRDCELEILTQEKLILEIDNQLNLIKNNQNERNKQIQQNEIYKNEEQSKLDNA